MAPFEGTWDCSTWNNSASVRHTNLQAHNSLVLLLCPLCTISQGWLHSRVLSDGDSPLGLAADCLWSKF